MEDKSPSNNLDNILLATDGSCNCAGAVREAIGLALRCGAKLTAISVVVANQEFLAYAPDLVEKQEMDAERHLEMIKAQAVKAGVECAIAPHVGDPAYNVIVETAARSSSKLIVMGRRGMSGIAKVTMGSVTARVIGHSPVNVLVVPCAARMKCQAVMAATDGSKYGDAAVREGIRFARRCGSSLSVLSVAGSESGAGEAERALNNAKAIAALEDFEITPMVAFGRAYAKIIQTARTNKIDLIVVSSHGHNALEKLLMGSVTDRVIGLSDCAVLVARAF